MRFFIIPLLLLSTSTAYATSAEECMNMARDYLSAVENNQSDTQIIFARESFLSRCNTDNTFNQNLIKLVVDYKIIKALEVRKNNNHRHANLSAM